MGFWGEWFFDLFKFLGSIILVCIIIGGGIVSVPLLLDALKKKKEGRIKNSKEENSRNEYRSSELNYKILVYLREVIRENIEDVPDEVENEVPAKWLSQTMISLDKWNMTITDISRDNEIKIKRIKSYSDFGYEKSEWTCLWDELLARDLQCDFRGLNIKHGWFTFGKESYQISVGYKSVYDKNSPYK